MTPDIEFGLKHDSGENNDVPERLLSCRAMPASDYDLTSYLKHSAMGMGMELSLCFLLVSVFGENLAMVFAMLLLWILIRASAFVAATAFVSRRLLCITFLLNITPFLMYFCWIAVDFLDFSPNASCVYGALQRNITAAQRLVAGRPKESVAFETHDIVCTPKRWQTVSSRLPVVTVIVSIAQIGVPVLYAFMVLGALQRFSTETIKKRYTQLQLIVLDFLDACNGFTIFFQAQNFVYFRNYTGWRDPLLLLFGLVFLLALLEVCMAYGVIRCGGSENYRIIALLSLLINIPLGALRTLFVAMGLQATYPFLAKNFICMITELAIMVSGDMNNIVSSRIKDFLSMLPGAERLENKVDKENIIEQTAKLVALHGALREATELSPNDEACISVEIGNGVINRSKGCNGSESHITVFS